MFNRAITNKVFNEASKKLKDFKFKKKIFTYFHNYSKKIINFLLIKIIVDMIVY